MVRNHKPSATICKCSKCGALNPSAPPDHPHRNCSEVRDGVLHIFRSSMTRGTWRKIPAEDYAEELAAQRAEHTRGPTVEEQIECDLLRGAATLEAPPAPCSFLAA